MYCVAGRVQFGVVHGTLPDWATSCLGDILHF